jgi:uncharacterized protein
VGHLFRYRLFLVYVDLAELEYGFGQPGVWSTRRLAAARFCRGDHLGDPRRPLDECVRELVETEIGWRPTGPIRLLTHFRYFGFQMNPVSLYYCFDSSGREVQAVVAEVNNTPWQEQHCYVLDMRGQSASRRLTARHAKTFHVSPFLNMTLDYHWQMTVPGEQLFVHIDAQEGEAALLDASLVLRRRPLNRWHKTRMLLRYPWMTLRVYLGIHWQALRLWLKGVAVVPHPDRAVRREIEPHGTELRNDKSDSHHPTTTPASELQEVSL